MVWVYSIGLAVGLTALVAWILTHSLAVGSDRDRFDPEVEFGVLGRRAVAALVGFSMAGLSAEFSPRDLGWPVALVLALVGAAAFAWYAGRPNVVSESQASSAGTPD